MEVNQKVAHEDHNDVGHVVRVLSPTMVSVRWYRGGLKDEHIADLKQWPEPVKDIAAKWAAGNMPEPDPADEVDA